MREKFWKCIHKEFCAYSISLFLILKIRKAQICKYNVDIAETLQNLRENTEKLELSRYAQIREQKKKARQILWLEDQIRNAGFAHH